MQVIILGANINLCIFKQIRMVSKGLKMVRGFLRAFSSQMKSNDSELKQKSNYYLLEKSTLPHTLWWPHHKFILYTSLQHYITTCSTFDHLQKLKANFPHSKYQNPQNMYIYVCVYIYIYIYEKAIRLGTHRTN